MENKRLLDLETKLHQYIEELKAKKKEVKFNDSLKEYKKIKKDLWKANKKLKENEDLSKTQELEINLQEVENKKEEIIKTLKVVEVIEEKVYSVKKQIISIISSLDKAKNTHDYYGLTLENRNELLNNTIDKKYETKLKKEIQKLEEENVKILEEIEKLKTSKKPFKFLTYKLNKNKSQINKINSEIKINSNKDSEKVKKQIERNQQQIDIKKSASDVLGKEIDFALKLIEEIDHSLEFIDSDEINKEASFTVKHLDVFYGSKQALFDINIEFPKNEVIAIIGPSGCGKSTFLRTLNRINDNIPSFSAKGKILLDGEYDIFKLRSIKNRYDKIELSTLRTKVGMIFQQPNPFPMSIAKNVQYGPKVKGIKNAAYLNELTENSLKEAGLWNEVKDNLKALGTSLSGGQQQRLCIARAIANKPEILLMDEPTSALDPIAAKKIEDLILKLKEHYTVIMVTHSMQQAQRISDKTAFFYQGYLIEYGDTKQVFEKPKAKETKEYVSGKFG